MKKVILFISLLFCLQANSQTVNFAVTDSTLISAKRNLSGVLEYFRARALFANELTRNTSSALKMMVFDSAHWANQTPPYFHFQNIPTGGGSGGGLVDSVLNNGAGDSLVVKYTAGSRLAYPYPSGGGSSNWVNSGSDAYLNANGTVGHTGIDARFHVVTTNNASPGLNNWTTTDFVVGRSGNQGLGVGISVTDATETAHFFFGKPGISWGSGHFHMNTFRIDNSGGTAGFYMDGSANVAFGSTTVNSGINNNTSISNKYNAQPGNYTLTSTDNTVLYGGAGSQTYTLPAAAGIGGRRYTIVHNGSGLLTVDPNASETFANLTGTPTTYDMAIGTMLIQSNGSNWDVISLVQPVPVTLSYTPSLTNTTNIAASTPYTTYYYQSGDWVHVWGEVDIDATAATTISELRMDVPVSTSLNNSLFGTAAAEDNTTVRIFDDLGGTVRMRFTPNTATNNRYSFHYSYKWIAP